MPIGHALHFRFLPIPSTLVHTCDSGIINVERIEFSFFSFGFDQPKHIRFISGLVRFIFACIRAWRLATRLIISTEINWPKHMKEKCGRRCGLCNVARMESAT